jgi:hypothetical protein
MTQDNPTAKSVRGRGEDSGESSGIADKTHEAAEQVRDAALSRVESVRKTAVSAKEGAAERVRALGATVRKVGEHLRVEDQNYIADKAGDMSRRLDDVASYISSAEVGTLVRDAEDVAREKPMVFYGGALLVGLAAGRFLKVTGASLTSSSQVQSTRTRAAGRRGSMQDEAALPSSGSSETSRAQREGEPDEPARASRRAPIERGVGR